MAVFMGLIIPLPFTIKRKLFTFISESPVIAKLQYGLKVGGSLYHSTQRIHFLKQRDFNETLQITFIFILILFIDSVNRVYRVQLELAAYGKEGTTMGLVYLLYSIPPISITPMVWQKKIPVLTSSHSQAAEPPH